MPFDRIPTPAAPRARRRRGIVGGAAALAAAFMVALTPLSQAVARGAPESFADLAEKLSPAVVNISTSQTINAPERPSGPRLPENSPFRELFPDLFGDEGDAPRRGPRKASSLGSGFVISADGYIVTNNHVIDGADEIKANFADGSSLDARLIGTDPKTDIALLKVEPDAPLTFVSFGNSDASRVGEWVLAIGNPFGLGGSVSAGIISARNRNINAGPYDDFIQTDAAINRGNSGGPLFNMDGEVIGVNTAIISPSGGSIGIGFSVPSAIASRVVDQIQEYGATRRGWLGVQIQTVTPELAEGLGLEAAAGALVTGVVDDGPAADAGIEVGDVIMRFDGNEVDAMRDLPRMVAETEVGKAVRVVVWRKGESRTLKVTLGLLEEEPPVQNASVTQDEAPAEEAEVLGLALGPLTDKRREAFGIAGDVSGVLITEVNPDGAGAEKGLRQGDVIVEVSLEPVSDPKDVADKVAEARENGRKSVMMLVHTRGEGRFVALSLEE
ncbi:DegQ family serine endoprotease [Rhodovulum sp. DZ06]|uniref:DegQ family serine endoprotease n=1 Tax=Rhodovulum sp. DZ06 TaxID=3425126 RepID=UPI003D345B11